MTRSPNCHCDRIQAEDSKRHFKGCPARDDGYEPPNLIQLRLENKVANDAAKWWKVEEFIQKELSFGVSTEAYALRDFIVKLSEEK